MPDEPRGIPARLADPIITMIQHYWKLLVNFGFRLLYNELAWTYDAVSWLVSLGSWREWQRATLPFIMGNQVLEVGHGPGHMLAALKLARFSVVGLDLSPYMGQLARGKAAGPLVRGRVQQLPFVSATFDTVLSTFPTEFLVDPQSLSAIHRVLQPQGRFVVVPEAHLTGTTPLHRFIEWLFTITGQRQGPFAAPEAQQPPHLDQWDILRRQLEAAGFDMTIEQIQLPRSEVTVLLACKK
jgi:ubiquinone/menaquinone biosynthesis C-methylase UbiE